MNIICIKCPPVILEKFLNTADKVSVILDSWDKKNVIYSAVQLKKLEYQYTVESLDSIEELSAIAVDIQTKGIAIDKVITAAEYGVFACGFLNAVLMNDVSHLNHAINTRDKRAMKTKFKNLGLLCADFITITNCTELNNLNINNLFLPVVAKPVCDTGSFNTQKLNTAEELQDYFRLLSRHPAILSQQIVLEEFIGGEEYHVDAVWKDGVCVFMVVSKYIIPRIQVIENPKKNGSCIVTERDQPSLFQYLREAHHLLSAEFNITQGASHLEIFVHDKRVYFSEIANRFAGAYVPEAIKNATGVNLIEAWVHSVLEQDINIKASSETVKHCGWLNICPESEGIVSNVPTAQEISVLPWVRDFSIKIKEGDKYTLDNPSNWSLFLVIEADSYSDYLNKVDLTHEKLKVEVRPVYE